MCMIRVWRHILDLCVHCVGLSPTQWTHTPQVQNMPPNTDHAHNKHMWTIICNFNQVQAITPWWWILWDPEHVGVICGNKMPTRCNRGFYCRSYCLLIMFQAPLCPSSGAHEYYTVVAACGISCCGFQVAGLVWSWGLCVQFAGCLLVYCNSKPASILQTGHILTRMHGQNHIKCWSKF